MKHKIYPNHVALLVPSVLKAAEYFKPLRFLIGRDETFEKEGTREIYIHKDHSNSLLLIEAIQDGPYQRALQKRGPGLHHIAIDVFSLENQVKAMIDTGWKLHPYSLLSMAKSKTAYFSWPGFLSLIEVQERASFSENPRLVTQIQMPEIPEYLKLSKSIGLEDILVPLGKIRFKSSDIIITAKGQTFLANNLF